jgi:hypothetical protein
MQLNYYVQAGESATKIEFEGGTRVYFNLRDGRHTSRETPLVCVFYEGASPEREMDYFEMSIYLLDGVPMIGEVAASGHDAPAIRFLNLTEEINRQLAPALAEAFAKFVESKRAAIEALARTTTPETT